MVVLMSFSPMAVAIFLSLSMYSSIRPDQVQDNHYPINAVFYNPPTRLPLLVPLLEVGLDPPEELVLPHGADPLLRLLLLLASLQKLLLPVRHCNRIMEMLKPLVSFPRRVCGPDRGQTLGLCGSVFALMT